MADHSHDQHDHVVGTMDISEHEKTFAGFIRMVTWGAIISIGVLVFMGLANA
ncbi:aa3-type cytochrome c oxidase subunit IV [Cereibacter changlensis]|uniref:Aa3-type cytochrome c oxidase subunit IV n=1 Tax=Cereibacter changlensis TaxID=402884 RepID=A0A4U0Z1F0_9RHOB|nr:aa3-type cytochrome c oxidase subunit IV [Cereibacter changlensis]TKA96171.1 aa3-type cytochrome c oxidase subunit IV [Cereibacter changlensis]